MDKNEKWMTAPTSLCLNFSIHSLIHSISIYQVPAVCQSILVLDCCALSISGQVRKTDVDFIILKYSELNEMPSVIVIF